MGFGVELNTLIDNVFPLDLAIRACSEEIMQLLMAHRAPCNTASVVGLIMAVGPVSVPSYVIDLFVCNAVCLFMDWFRGITQESQD